MKHLTVNVNTRDLNLYPVSDVQIGAAGVDVDGFSQYVQEAAGDPIGRVFGGGDYTDGVSPSNRRVLLSAFIRGDLYDTPQEMLDTASRQQVRDFIRLVEPLRDKTDFLLKGHHWYPYTVRQNDGTQELRSSDHDIAEFLNAPYCGEPDEKMGMALVRYTFPPLRKGGERPVLRLLAFHGQGGGHSFAGPLNQLERQMRGHNADVYFVAHHHKLVAAAAAKLHDKPLHPTHLGATDARMVGGGSWLRGFLPDRVTYAEDGLMVPLSIGAPIIRIRGRQDGSFRIRVEV